MSLRMNRFGKPLEIGNPHSYKPYINYKWATKIDALGNRDLIDSGKARLNADLYFGQHMLLNGVDQQITIDTVNAVAIYVFRNGIFTTIDVSLVDSYVLSDNATYSNAVSSSFIFSDAQITYFVNTPEKFLYREDNILKSKILTQDEIDNVVAYLPMCENDGYVRDLVGYGEGSDLNIDGNASFSASVDATIISTNSGIFSDSSKYIISFTISNYTEGSVSISEPISSGLYSSNGTFEMVIDVDTLVSNSLDFTSSGTSTSLDIATNYIKEVTSTYPIQNYTSAVRTDAQQLTSGLQTCFLKRDSLGVPYGGSFDRLECDGVGYADTGWIPLASEDFTIELIQEFANNSEYNLNGANDSSTSRMYIGEDSGGNATMRMAGIINTISTSTSINHLVLSFNSVSKEMVSSLNGISQSAKDVSTFTDMVSSFNLAKEANNVYDIEKPIRLFKVHTTPQDPLKLYQDAVNKGLLS